MCRIVYKNIVSINDDFVQTTNGRLAANNVGFYFDYKDGEYGWNSSSARGADTFTPFKQGGSVSIPWSLSAYVEVIGNSSKTKMFA